MIDIYSGKVLIKELKSNDWENKETGKVTTFYNVKVVNLNPKNFDVQTLDVTEELFNKLKVEKEYFLGGTCGGSGKNKWWRFTDILDTKDKD